MARPYLSRREFLQTTAGVAGASLAGSSMFLDSSLAAAETQTTAPSDRVRFGIVGVGMEGSGLLTTAVKLQGVECVAAADLYDGRHELATEIVGKPIKTTRRYKELLDDKGIDAIIVAVPDFWHKQVVVDALAAGKDVYCEKPMSHSPADGLAMVAAAKKTDRIVQVGAQRTSSVLCAKAKELYQQGAIGELSLVEATMGRNSPNGAWEYPPPPDLSLANLDWNTWLLDTPKRPLDPNLFARWRCWRGVWHRCCRRPACPSDQRHAVCARHQRGPQEGVDIWWHLSLERRTGHARCPSRSLRIRQRSCVYAANARHRVERSYALHGLEGDHRTPWDSVSPISRRQAWTSPRAITPALTLPLSELPMSSSGTRNMTLPRVKSRPSKP